MYSWIIKQLNINKNSGTKHFHRCVTHSQHGFIQSDSSPCMKLSTENRIKDEIILKWAPKHSRLRAHIDILMEWITRTWKQRTMAIVYSKLSMHRGSDKLLDIVFYWNILTLALVITNNRLYISLSLLYNFIGIYFSIFFVFQLSSSKHIFGPSN